MLAPLLSVAIRERLLASSPVPKTPETRPPPLPLTTMVLTVQHLGVQLLLIHQDKYPSGRSTVLMRTMVLAQVRVLVVGSPIDYRLVIWINPKNGRWKWEKAALRKKSWKLGAPRRQRVLAVTLIWMGAQYILRDWTRMTITRYEGDCGDFPCLLFVMIN